LNRIARLKERAIAARRQNADKAAAEGTLGRKEVRELHARIGEIMPVPEMDLRLVRGSTHYMGHPCGSQPTTAQLAQKANESGSYMCRSIIAKILK
jgi:hypothetical protein